MAVISDCTQKIGLSVAGCRSESAGLGAYEHARAPTAPFAHSLLGLWPRECVMSVTHLVTEAAAVLLST